jgi:phosphate regulon transcriptional regulator PhoB
MSSRILIVEDEASIASTLAFNLKQEGYETLTAATGERALELARSFQPDLVLLDLMLPGIGGLDLCRYLRRERDVPIIMVTARSSELDRVLGLELGADDYITKPFSMRELLARVRTVLRRASSRPAEDNEVLEADEVKIDRDRHRVLVRGREVPMTPREYDLLCAFLRNRGRVLSREVLLERVWGEDAFVEPRTVDVHIRWLREKIEEDPSHPVLIQTVRGVGYRFGE